MMYSPSISSQVLPGFLSSETKVLWASKSVSVQHGAGVPTCALHLPDFTTPRIVNIILVPENVLCDILRGYRIGLHLSYVLGFSTPCLDQWNKVGYHPLKFLPKSWSGFM